MTFVPIFSDPCSDQSLVFCEGGENSKDDGNAGIELNAHEAVRDGVGYILEVHGFAFDQNADGDHHIKGLGGHRFDHCRRGVGRGRGRGGRSRCGSTGGERGTEGESAEKVCRRRARLDSRACYHPIPKQKLRIYLDSAADSLSYLETAIGSS